jgi:hypothetical protein
VDAFTAERYSALVCTTLSFARLHAEAAGRLFNYLLLHVCTAQDVRVHAQGGG